jgi:hypothetical protein
LQEAKVIDGAYNLAFQVDTMSEPTPQATTTPSVVEASHFATLHVHKGPKFFL